MKTQSSRETGLDVQIDDIKVPNFQDRIYSQMSEQTGRRTEPPSPFVAKSFDQTSCERSAASSRARSSVSQVRHKPIMSTRESSACRVPSSQTKPNDLQSRTVLQFDQKKLVDKSDSMVSISATDAHHVRPTEPTEDVGPGKRMAPSDIFHLIHKEETLC